MLVTDDVPAMSGRRGEAGGGAPEDFEALRRWEREGSLRDEDDAGGAALEEGRSLLELRRDCVTVPVSLSFCLEEDEEWWLRVEAARWGRAAEGAVGGREDRVDWERETPAYEECVLGGV